MARSLHIAIAGPVATADVQPLLDSRGPWPRGYSGAPLMATLIEALLQRGHRLSVVTLSADLPLRSASHKGSRVTAHGPGLSLTWCPMRPRAWPMNATESALWLPGRIVDLYRFERQQLRTALRGTRADLVHAHWAYEFAAAAIGTRMPHLITCHDLPRQSVRDLPRLRHRAYRWLRARLAARVMARAQALSAPSPWLAEALAADARVPIHLVPNPLADEFFASDAAAARHRAAQMGRARVLVVCHGFSRTKNLRPGLKAFALLSARRPEVELVMLGEQMGPEEEAERWWREQGLSGRVRFAGAVSPAVVRHWMNQSDVLLHPALVEGFGMVVAEAMALGLPVVAGAHSGAVPWVLGGAGVLVDIHSPPAIAEALERVLHDRGAALQRAAIGRDEARERFAAGLVAEGYEALYREVLATAATRAR